MIYIVFEHLDRGEWSPCASFYSLTEARNYCITALNVHPDADYADLLVKISSCPHRPTYQPKP